MPNPFTDESRDARFKLGVEGFCDTLRAPSSLHLIVMGHKPAVLSVGDFTLKAMLDSCIDGMKVAGDYRGIQSLLDTLFGPAGTERHPATTTRAPQVPVGTSSAERHPGRATKPGAAA